MFDEKTLKPKSSKHYLFKFQWYFYMKRRHLAHEWKIQPTKWLTPELERHEIMIGTMSLFIVGSFSAFLACYIINDNPSSVYYQFDEYGWLWFFLQFPIVFIYSVSIVYVICSIS